MPCRLAKLHTAGTHDKFQRLNFKCVRQVLNGLPAPRALKLVEGPSLLASLVACRDAGMTLGGNQFYTPTSRHPGDGRDPRQVSAFEL